VNQFLTVPPGTYSDATLPAMATDGNNNVFVAWQDTIRDQTTNQPVDHRILAVKLNSNGGFLTFPIRVDTAATNTVRSSVSLAVQNVCSGSGQACMFVADCPSGQTCSASAVVLSWWEGFNSGPETVFRKRLSSTLGNIDVTPIKVNQPPALPSGVQRATSPSVAVDASNNFVVAWQANVNDADILTSLNGFGRSFSSAAVGLKNDFRIDLNGRSIQGATRAARSSQAKSFVYAWRDDRSGHFDIYTRRVQSLP